MQSQRQKPNGKEPLTKVTGPTNAALPSDAQVIGAVQRTCWAAEATVLHAAGGLPGEMHKLWQAGAPGSYHAEYGFSCMGYEIAGGLGAKMAKPDDEVVVMIGDGSYLMLNSELATSVMLGQQVSPSCCSTIAAMAASTGCKWERVGPTSIIF